MKQGWMVGRRMRIRPPPPLGVRVVISLLCLADKLLEVARVHRYCSEMSLRKIA